MEHYWGFLATTSTEWGIFMSFFQCSGLHTSFAAPLSWIDLLCWYFTRSSLLVVRLRFQHLRFGSKQKLYLVLAFMRVMDVREMVLSDISVQTVVLNGFPKVFLIFLVFFRTGTKGNGFCHIVDGYELDCVAFYMLFNRFVKLNRT